MSEQQSEAATATETGDKWGDPISPERQGYLDWWEAETNHGQRTGPFDNVQLTGADVHWLANQSGYDALDGVPNLHLEGADLREARLQGTDLRAAHLERANLWGIHLEAASLRGAHLEDSNLIDSHPETLYC